MATCGMGDDSVPLFLPLESPVVGYCVEMLDSPYSRYQRCNSGGMRDGVTDPLCSCQNGGNREQAVDSAAAMALQCDADGGDCKCCEDSQRMSDKWTGRMDSVMGASMKMVDAPVGGYVSGYWYSTPRGGECPAGLSLGTGGCTWRRKPLAQMIWLVDLIEAGFDNTPTELNFTKARWEQNLAACAEWRGGGDMEQV